MHICEFESCSSLLHPNHKLLSKFQHLSDWLEVKAKVAVDTTRLNDINLPFQPDYIKSDIQGADLYAIEHGYTYIEKALAVEIEVEFIQQYENQPLFSEIEIALRQQGFIFHSFTGYGSRLLKPAIDEEDPYRTLNQWMWSHAVFFKDFLTKELSEEDYFKLAVIANDIYSSYDVALHCLSKCKALSSVTKDYNSYFKEVIAHAAV